MGMDQQDQHQTGGWLQSYSRVSPVISYSNLPFNKPSRYSSHDHYDSRSISLGDPHRIVETFSTCFEDCSLEDALRMMQGQNLPVEADFSGAELDPIPAP